MKIGMILLCRYDSTRLHGKILKKIKRKNIIKYILERLVAVGDNYPIWVATSNEKSDDPIVRFCKANSISFHRGSKSNVALRFLNCALKMKIDYAIRINGDNIFTDPYVIIEMIKLAKTGKYSFLSNVFNRTYPEGVSVEIVKVSLLKNKITLFDSYDKEHVMSYFYNNLNNSDIYKFYNQSFPIKKDIKLAIDDKNDFAFATKILSKMKKPHEYYNTGDLIELIEENNIS
tara:strand:- start:97 stop:789 length:693 start_codon:yes stop_codon:yes gene_type:complete